MKKTLLLLIALGLSLSLSAQQTEGWFLGAGTGMNFGFDGLKYEDRATSHNGAGFAVDAYAGGWFTKVFGFRAGWQGYGISDRYTDFGNRQYNYIHGDLLMRAHRNIVPYIHGGYVNIVNSGIGGGAGIAFPIYVAKRLAIVPDVKATAYSSHVFGVMENNVAMTVSATIGLSINLGGRKRKPAPAPAIDLPPVQVIHDTVHVKEIINRETIVRDTVYIEHHDTTVLHPEKISALALFDTDKSVLRPEVFPDLNRIVAWFQKYPDAHAVIEGHTDSTASAAYNQALSERRAQAVYIYLISHGVAADRLTWIGYGLTRPVAPNDTPEGRQRNRRVEIHVE